MNGRVDPTEAGPCSIGHRIRSGADGVAIEATAPCLAILLDEAAIALAEIVSGSEAGAPASWWEDVELQAGDLPNLAAAWLDELIARAAAHRALFVDAALDRVDRPPEIPGGRWHVRGRAGLRVCGAVRASSQPGPFHTVAGGTTVGEIGGTWTLRVRIESGRRPAAPGDRDCQATRCIGGYGRQRGRSAGSTAEEADSVAGSRRPRSVTSATR